MEACELAGSPKPNGAEAGVGEVREAPNAAPKPNAGADVLVDDEGTAAAAAIVVAAEVEGAEAAVRVWDSFWAACI